jgi:hypothetical protein
MSQRIIPGHIRAYTFWWALIVALMAGWLTRSWLSGLGGLVLGLGGFLGDQATHLAQMDHSGPPPTWLERQQQNHRVLFVVAGYILTAAGVWIIIWFRRI